MIATAAAMPIPDILRDFRSRKNLSQRSLAQHLGVSATAVNEWEHGKRTPDPAYCEVIAAKLELPVEFVLAEAGHIAARAFAEPRESYDVLVGEATAIARALRSDPEGYELWLAMGRRLVRLQEDSNE